MSEPDHHQSREENDDSAERDLDKGQIFRLRSQSEKWSDKIIERVHSEKTSRDSRLLRVSQHTPISP